MKIYPVFLFLGLLFAGKNAGAQAAKVSAYFDAVKFYDAKDYLQAAKLFDVANSNSLSDSRLYTGACIYALNKEKGKAFSLLNDLAEKRYYANYGHLLSDADLAGLRSDGRWAPLIEKVKRNSLSMPQRKLAGIYSELAKARQLLERDGGKLWGYPIWDEHVLVLDVDNTVYAINAFAGSSTEDGKLFYAKVPAGTFVFVNTVQRYKGQDYAVVLSSYLSDHSITIIHELFHLLQLKHGKLNGNAIKYLDNYDAREWLRMEYQALRNALAAISGGRGKTAVTSSLQDALLFRKLRQGKYREFVQDELEIETLEGLANYTGFALSDTQNRYETAIAEIYQRESAQTYTRPFPYATGVAYGLVFDHLGLQWKHGLEKVYDFLAIYEAGKRIDTGKQAIARAQVKNNFKQIHLEEQTRKLKNDSLLAYYIDILQVQPTLRVAIDGDYGRTFNMNGTLEMPGIGTVYSSIKGRDKSGKNFGSFTTIEDKAYLGKAGVLMLNDFKTLVFPAPFRLEGNKIIGETYLIELQQGWGIEKIDEKGNYLIKRI